MDKNGTTFVLKSFAMNLGARFDENQNVLKDEAGNIKFGKALIPNFQTLTKVVRDMVSALPKGVAELIKADVLGDTVKAFKEKNTFEDAIHGMGRWVGIALDSIAELEPEQFIGKRGRDTSNLSLELFGTKKLVPEWVGDLIAGSKLATIMQSGPQSVAGWAGDGSWKDLHTVFNAIKTELGNAVPTQFKPTRQSNKAVEAEPAEVAEPTATEDTETEATE